MNETVNERLREWQERIRDYRNSGLTMRAWCDSRDITFNQLKYWLRKLSAGPQKQSAVTWVTMSPTHEVPSAESPLVVRIGNVSIDIYRGFDQTLLGQIVHALEVRS